MQWYHHYTIHQLTVKLFNPTYAMAPWEKKIRQVQYQEEKTHTITNNGSNGGIMLREAFQILEVCGEQILEGKIEASFSSQSFVKR